MLSGTLQPTSVVRRITKELREIGRGSSVVAAFSCNLCLWICRKSTIYWLMMAILFNELPVIFIMSNV
jgi:hypothetical protein